MTLALLGGCALVLAAQLAAVRLLRPGGPNHRPEAPEAAQRPRGLAGGL